MWLRRLFRRRGKSPPLDPSALDRLEELIAHVIELVPQAAAAEEHSAAAQAVVGPEPAEETAPEPAASNHVLLLPGYTLHERSGPAPACGTAVEHEGRVYTVLRLGPSPLPADRRRCVFVDVG